MIRRLFNTVFEGAIINPIEANTPCYPHPFTLSDTVHFGWLSSVAPCFPVSSHNIKIITEPKQFYDHLLHYCKNASDRLTLVSLYLGTGDLENQLIEAVKQNKQFQNKKLNINILLDYTRGSRGKVNSRTMLKPLLKCNENCNISLYHTPALRGMLKRFIPNRWNELLGLQHMKLYIFDDVLIISGANLSNDYFTNRQDRYMLIKDKKLTDFYCELVTNVESFCLKMDEEDNLSFPVETWKCSPYEGSKKAFTSKAREIVESFINKSFNENVHSIQKSDDTWIFPTLQMGQLDIKQDSYITDRLLAEAPSESKLRIATGYFNLTSQYMHTLVHDCKAEVEILMAHPRANGFLDAKGPAGGIPYAYSLIAEKFRRMCEVHHQQYRIKLLEYMRKGWTYHGKGLWYYPPKSKYPCLSIIGSPNFGDRSVTKDLETQLVIVTENNELRKCFHEESQRLYKLGLEADTKRQVPLWVNVFVLLFRSYF